MISSESLLAVGAEVLSRGVPVGGFSQKVFFFFLNKFLMVFCFKKKVFDGF